MMKNTEEEDASILKKKKQLMHAPNAENGVVLDRPRGVALSEATVAYKLGKRKKSRKKKKLESGVQNVACKSQRDFLVQEEAVEPTEAGTVQASDNQPVCSGVALSEAMEEYNEGEKSQKNMRKRKKLESSVQNVACKSQRRGPRYYDPPAETCYNCGEEGHATVNCAANYTAAKELKKPCFLCGSLMHQANRCIKERDCIICRKVGHPAKHCRRMHVGDSICLRCGISGHDMFSCGNFYSLYDLKEIQCYVCKSFGHLCCANATGSTPTEISCYKCGQTGHTGLACSGEGLFYRELWSNGEVQYVKKKVRKRNHKLSKTKSPTFQEENGYMGDRSAPHDMGRPYIEKMPLTEERAIQTQQPLKHRGGCRVEHLDEMSPSESKRNSWMSPVTPSTN